MKRFLLGVLAAATLSLGACSSTSTPAPTSVPTVTASSSVVVSSAAPVSSAPSSSAPAPESTPSVSVPSTETSTTAPVSSPAPTCVEPSRESISYTITGNVVRINVTGKLCKPLYVRVQNWKSIEPGEMFPQKQVGATSIKVTRSLSFTMAKLASQQDIYASTKNDLAAQTPAVLESASADQADFLSDYATGPTAFRQTATK